MADATQILRDLLNKIAVEQGFNTYDIEIKPISSGGANYTSILFVAKISGDKDDLKLFAKVATMGEKMRESTSSKMYDTERYFYTTLVNIYREMEDRHKLPAEHRIDIPKYYGNNPNLFEETIVLEDLVSKGYKVYDRTISMDWKYASRAVEELAKLHALSFALAKENPEKFEEAFKILKFDFDMLDGQQEQLFEKSLQSAVQVLDDEHKEKLINFMQNFNFKTYQELLQPIKKPVLIHGDFRVSNQMYKTNEDGSITIKLMDFQTMQGGSPVLDLIYLIFTGTDEEFRREYYQKLVDYYYEQLCAAMRRLEVDPDDIYPREDYDQELKKKLPFGLIVSLFTLPIVTVEAEHAPVIDENADISSFFTVKVGGLYPKRMRGTVSDYVRWGIL